jgi:hypothetical protein
MDTVVMAMKQSITNEVRFISLLNSTERNKRVLTGAPHILLAERSNGEHALLVPVFVKRDRVVVTEYTKMVPKCLAASKITVTVCAFFISGNIFPYIVTDKRHFDEDDSHLGYSAV